MSKGKFPCKEKKQKLFKKPIQLGLGIFALMILKGKGKVIWFDMYYTLGVIPKFWPFVVNNSKNKLSYYIILRFYILTIM